jgi:cell division protease FtsH
MSSLGPVSFGGQDELVFLGREISEQRNYSEKVATEIDREVSKLIREAEDRANKILLKKKVMLEKIAETLVEKETIEKEEFDKLIIAKKEKRTKPSTKKEKSVKVSGERV